MYCPVDNETLVMTERNGVEIDYCPKCRGVWLDRGELDKILERSSASSLPASARSGFATEPVALKEPQRPEPARVRRGDHDDDYDDDDDRRTHKKKRKEGFLSELFDF